MSLTVTLLLMLVVAAFAIAALAIIGGSNTRSETDGKLHRQADDEERHKNTPLAKYHRGKGKQ
jgi:hypothetical protein